MPRFRIPTFVTINSARHFFAMNRPFDQDTNKAVLEFPPNWVHLEPMALSMISAWGAWCRRTGFQVRAENLNLGKSAEYLSRMKLFHHLGIDFEPRHSEHEEAGRLLK